MHEVKEKTRRARRYESEASLEKLVKEGRIMSIPRPHDYSTNPSGAPEAPDVSVQPCHQFTDVG